MHHLVSGIRIGEFKESKPMGSCPRVLHVSFSCVTGFSLVLDHRGSLGGLGRTVGSACEEFEDNKGDI